LYKIKRTLWWIKFKRSWQISSKEWISIKYQNQRAKIQPKTLMDRNTQISTIFQILQPQRKRS